MGKVVARVKTKRVPVIAARAVGTQPVPTVGAAAPAIAAVELELEDEDTQVIDEAELAALLAQSENGNARDG